MKANFLQALWFLMLSCFSLNLFSEYSWLQMISNGHYIVRCVQEGNNTFLPTFTSSVSQKGKSQESPMTLRFDGSKDLLIDGKKNTEMFPIKVYEGVFKASQGAEVTVQCGNKATKQSWTIPSFEDKEVPDFVIFGDSGCNPLKYQYCPLAVKNNEEQKKDQTVTTWEFPKLVEHALRNFASASFFVHVGDYVYQGGYGFKDGLSKTANWLEWEADFFVPMNKMLLKMPGIFIRGNHETAGSNSGLGWFILLDPYTLKETKALSGLKEKGNVEVLTKPWSTPISQKVNAVVWDNSVTNLYEDPYGSKKMASERMDNFVKEESNQLLKSLVRKDKDNWLFAHVPLFGLNEDGDLFDDPEKDGADDLENIVYQTNFNNFLTQSKFSDIGTRQGWLRMYDKATNRKVFSDFSYFVAGDVHTMQKVRPLNKKGHLNYPIQVICGGSGVKLDKLAECINMQKTPCRVARFNQVSDYSFKDKKTANQGHWGVNLAVSGEGVKAIGYITHESQQGGKSHHFTIHQILKEEKAHAN